MAEREESSYHDLREVTIVRVPRSDVVTIGILPGLGIVPTSRFVLPARPFHAAWRFRLFDLPGELRNLFYEHALAGRGITPNWVDGNFDVQCAPLLRASRQIYREANDYLYLDKTFNFSLYHNVDCVRQRGGCGLETCTQRCIKIDWGSNEQSTPTCPRGPNKILPPWTSKIVSAYIEVIIDAVDWRLVTRGNILAALNSFLHVFSETAHNLQKLHVKFVVKRYHLNCPHLFSVLYPIARCPKLKKLILEDIPTQDILHEKLNKQLQQEGRVCPDYEKIAKLVDRAQRMLFIAQNNSVDEKARRRMADCINKPQYQFRTRCLIQWNPLQSAAVWQIPWKRPEQPHDNAGILQSMRGLAKSERLFRRMEKANLCELDEELALMREALKEAGVEWA